MANAIGADWRESRCPICLRPAGDCDHLLVRWIDPEGPHEASPLQAEMERLDSATLLAVRAAWFTDTEPRFMEMRRLLPPWPGMDEEDDDPMPHDWRTAPWISEFNVEWLEASAGIRMTEELEGRGRRRSVVAKLLWAHDREVVRRAINERAHLLERDAAEWGGDVGD